MKARHFGLAGMAERGNQTGTELVLVAAPGMGTRVQVVWKPYTSQSGAVSADD